LHHPSFLLCAEGGVFYAPKPSIMKYWLFILFTAGLQFALNGQSGWSRAEGGLYAQASYYGFSSDEYYSIDNTRFAEGATFSTRVLNLYAEHGFTDQFTLIANLPAVVINQFSTTNAVGSIGDFIVTAKYGINQDKRPISFSLGIEVPTGSKDLFASAKEPNSFGIIEEINLPTGDGELNFLATVAASQSFWGGKAYGSLFTTYNYRTQEYSGQWRLGAEVGAKPLPGVWLSVQWFSQLRGLEGNNENTSFFRAEGTTYNLISFGLSYNLTDQWSLLTKIHLPVENVIAPYQNVYVGPGLTAGIAYSLSGKNK
jgi:hypothetical protein